MINYFISLKSKKGFTLVEVIITLVIISIIAAFAVPSLSGYVEQSDYKAMQSEAMDLYKNAQTAVFEQYLQSTKVFKAYLKKKRDSKHNFFIDENNQRVYIGNFTNSSLSTIYKEYHNSGAHDAKENEVDFQIARRFMKQIDCLESDSAKYTFSTDCGLAKNNITTADAFFSKCPNENIAITVMYDDTGRIVRMYFAKRGFSDIVMIENGEATLVKETIKLYNS